MFNVRTTRNGQDAQGVCVRCTDEGVFLETCWPEWLTEVLHLGSTSSSADGPSTLELDFRLPAASQYVPASAPDLPPLLKSPMTWEPNQRRSGMLKGWRFVFVGEKGREVDAEARTLVERGGDNDLLWNW